MDISALLGAMGGSEGFSLDSLLSKDKLQAFVPIIDDMHKGDLTAKGAENCFNVAYVIALEQTDSGVVPRIRKVALKEYTIGENSVIGFGHQFGQWNLLDLIGDAMKAKKDLNNEQKG